MRKLARHATAGVVALAAALALSATVGITGAYFTTYAAAKGSVEISLQDETSIDETVTNMTKHVVISNDVPENGSSISVFVRAKAFSGSTYPLVYTSADGKWKLGDDGYYYYETPLEPGQKTSVLDVAITNVPTANLKPGQNFDVSVVYETTPALYDDEGNAYADWNVKLDNGDLGGGE